MALLEAAGLPDRVHRRARRAFELLADAEARVHGLPVEEVHLHEVGAIDAIVDVAGAALGFELLGVDRIVSSGAVLGQGTLRSAHGVLPCPGPATARLLEGIPTQTLPIRRELTTPTGAAILAAFCDEHGPMPPCRIVASGYGAGAANPPERPNVCRIVLGEGTSASDPPTDALVLEANLDDLTPELAARALQALLEAGALDAWIVPVTMKKGRPGLVLSALCAPGDRLRLEAVFFRESTTFGVRSRPVTRAVLTRELTRVTTPWGDVSVKTGRHESAIVTATPEFESCRAVAETHGLPVRRVYQAALAAAHALLS